MRKLITIFIFSLVATFAAGQGIDFFHGTWEEALEKAGDENRLIFVDAYTTWCGPCKRMAAQVFPLQEVGDYYNANFINMKLDMERGEGLDFRKKYGVSSFPTFLWIDYNGEVVFTAKGARRPDDFIQLGMTAAEKYDGSAQFRVEYEDGSRDYEVVYNYVKELNKSGKSSLRVANDYLNEQSDLTTEENLRFIAVAATQVDSKPFELLVEHKDKIAGIEGKEAVDNIIRDACQATAEKAARYESADLLTQAEEAMEQHLPKEADLFSVTARMGYAATLFNAEDYHKYAKTYLKKYIDDQPETIEQIGPTVIKYFSSHPDLVKLGQEAAEEACDIHPTDENTIVLATLLFIGGDKEESLKVLDRAIREAELEKRPARQLESLRKRFDSA
jgi:thiol-disulfide isomerase/thioredoxin